MPTSPGGLPEGMQQQVPLAPFSTIGIGGPARYYTEAESPGALKQFLQWANQEQIPTLILGGGSNILCADSGFYGLVVRITSTGIEELTSSDNLQLLRVAAGENWDELVQVTVARNLQGIECLSGIPGTVGASPIQNIGAYGQEVKDTIVGVKALDRTTGKDVIFSNSDCEFSYRMSRFKGRDRDRYVITSVTFQLTPNGQPALRYGDLTRYFESEGIGEPSLAQVREAVLTIRKGKAMVFDLNEPNSRSCGSFFTNPIVPMGDYHAILENVRLENPADAEKMPAFPMDNSTVKLSAAWLMEKAGLQKGLKMGKVGLSEKHVLAITNCDNGTAAEVLDLVKHVQQSVMQRFGVHLEPEPIFIGFPQ